MNFRNIILPVAFLGAVCFLMNIATSFYIGPKSMVSLRDELTNIIKVRTPLAIEEGRFNTAFKDLVIMVREKPADETLKGVFIYDGRNETQPKVLTALEGKIFLSGGYQVHMDLREGCIHIVKGNTTTEIYFDRYQLALDLESMPPSRKISEFTPQEIVREISNPGLSKEDASRLVSLQIELHRRLSLPFLCIILIFLGPPLSLIAGKSGRLGGLVLGLLVFAVYYVLLIYAENLVKAGQLFHITGTWAPTVLLTIVAIRMFRKETNR
jgi:lipopolysaccharide export system permease protein